MEKAEAYIGLGANLGTPKTQCQQALAALEASKIEVERVSSFYRSEALLLPGKDKQPDFLNLVALVSTELAPLDLLDCLLAIERDLGRVRHERWGARCIDLDLLLYANIALNHERLTLPHPGVKQRSFVILPLLELAPNLRLPTGEYLANYRAGAIPHEITQLNSNHVNNHN